MNNNEKILKRAHKAKVFSIINLILLVALFVYVNLTGAFDIQCLWFNKGYDASRYGFYVAASIFAISSIVGLIVCLGSKNSPDWENLKSNDPYTLEDQGNSIRSLAKANDIKLPIVFPSMLILFLPIAAFMIINFNVMGFEWLHNGPNNVDGILAKQEKLEKEDEEDKDDKEDKEDKEDKVDEKIDKKDVDARIDAMIKIGEKRGYTCSSGSFEDSHFIYFKPEKILEDESLTIMVEKDGTITMVSYSCYFLPDLSVDENIERVESKIELLTDMVEELYDKGIIDSKEYYANVGLSDDFKDKIKNHSSDDDDFIMDDGEMDINSKYNTSASCMFFDDDTMIGIDVTYFD
ncbi:hypothetical protein [Pseudobutyrivibrio sp.]|uniref:hypothetical protein n=1 Tax=Pseudobutyrivibrio sp. TaxID=2014367 RepID=UPI0025F8565B|nr:hypothetical protein [Pseudobutyrivibrio sp.]MBR5648559.1 hypothetical protein [Pseudobutyrivibrio sp.]